MYVDSQQRYIPRTVSRESNGKLRSVPYHDYDHIEEEKFMYTFPTSSSDLVFKKRGSEVSVSGGVSGSVSLVPQPCIYSLPVECDRLPYYSPGPHAAMDKLNYKDDIEENNNYVH